MIGKDVGPHCGRSAVGLYALACRAGARMNACRVLADERARIARLGGDPTAGPRPPGL